VPLPDETLAQVNELASALVATLDDDDEARTSEDTRVLPPIEGHPRKPKGADKPLAVTADMVEIPAGPFIMGYDKRHPDEGPMHSETIDKPYWMDKHEVTNAQLARFMPAFPAPTMAGLVGLGVVAIATLFVPGFEITLLSGLPWLALISLIYFLRRKSQASG